MTLEGKRFEIPGRYRHLEQVQVRYARWDLSAVDLIDPSTHAVLGRLYPLNKTANARGRRRALETPLADTTPQQVSELPPLLRKLLADYAATGLPPAYLPKPTDQESDS